MDGDNDLVQQSQPRRRLDFQPEEESQGSRIDYDDIEVIHAKLSKDTIPHEGMEFEAEAAAYDFYNTYALAAGFSIRRSTVHDYEGKILDRKFVCSREGVRAMDKREHGYKTHRPETRCSCQAKLVINCRHTTNYVVTEFKPEHAHFLATPSKSHLGRSHRKIKSAQAAEIQMLENVGIPPKAGFDLMAAQGGGRESVGFGHIDYKNHLRTKRTIEMMSGDTGGVLEYLQQKQLEDPSFFYAIQVDEDDLITNIFWADGKMISHYEDFGDVTSLDTTYRKHKDRRPIALFVGVNHHKQTVIFGAALLYDETAASFMWLFDTFSEAMDGKLPQTILTDQDAAMAKALASQWPQTFHRLCVWHIFQNAVIHLSHVFSQFKDFSRDFSSCVYDFEHEDDFVKAWNEMLIKYDLQDNDWLERMFKIKEKWALVYGRETFCADMVTTQRSESMNKVIKHYVSYKHDLRKFFWHFDRLLSDRRYNETAADYSAHQSEVVLPPIEILKHAGNIYTPTVVKLFQAELFKGYDCNITDQSEVGMVTMYTISPPRKHYRYHVTYNAQENTIVCTCRKFEFGGLLCSHALKVLSTRGITRVPDKYILKRWTKGTRKGSANSNNENVLETDPKVRAGRRYRDLCRLAVRLSTKAAEDEVEYQHVKETLINLFEEIGLSSKEKVPQTGCTNYGATKGPSHEVVDSTGTRKTVKGIKVKPRSGNTSKRPKGPLERQRNTRAVKAKVSSRKDPVSSSSQSAQVNDLQPIIETTYMDSSLQQSQVSQTSQQIDSYQALLGMTYPDAERLMYDFIQPTQVTQETDKAQGPYEGGMYDSTSHFEDFGGRHNSSR